MDDYLIFNGTDGLKGWSAPEVRTDLGLVIGTDVQAYNADLTTSQINSAIASAVSDLIDSSPGALDTLNELAAALGDDADFAGTMVTSLALKQLILSEGAFVDGDKTKLDAALQQADIIDTLISTATDKALSAAQGKALKSDVDAKPPPVMHIPSRTFQTWINTRSPLRT